MSLASFCQSWAVYLQVFAVRMIKYRMLKLYINMKWHKNNKQPIQYNDMRGTLWMELAQAIVK